MPPPPKSLAETLMRYYRLTHERLLKVAEDLSPEQFAWSAGPSLHSVAWQLWHAARWDDFFAAHLHKELAREPLSPVWDRESLGDRWSFPTGTMGRRDTGTEMSDEAAEQIQFPSQKDVVGYARLAFAYADEGVELMPDDSLLPVKKDDPDGDSNLDDIFIYLEHLSRHLGMIESIRGLQGLIGSSTR